MNELEQIHKAVRCQLLDVLEERGELTPRALLRNVEAAADEDDIDLALQQLIRSRLVERVEGTGPARYRLTGEQPIAEPSDLATDRPANDASAAADPRFGLWSDGVLALQTAGGHHCLTPTETGALITYLVRERRLVKHLFDAHLEEARDA